MKACTRIIATAALLMAAAGCNSPDDPLKMLTTNEMAPPPGPAMQIEQTPEDIQRRFQADSEERTGAVQSAVLWAQRYEEMSLRNNELREQNSKLFLENNQLRHDAEKLQMALDTARRELAEANAFLQQMHVELNQWKSDVLGYRDEMRQAQRAQLEALAKILRLLGAEPAELPEKSS